VFKLAWLLLATVEEPARGDWVPRHGIKSLVGSSAMSLLLKFARCESGATAIEYGLIAALIAVACIGVITNVGTGIENNFDKAKNAMNGV
jgi:pilus assembly protein Flp/PilA